MVLGRCHDHAVDQDAGDLHLARVQGAGRRDALDLRDHEPLEFLAAMAIARLSSVSASRSMVMLPAGSAVVPRISATWIGNAL